MKASKRSGAALLFALSLSLGAGIAAPSAALGASATPAETAELKRIREEEKVARDVYGALYAKWGISPFRNIQASEQRHMDAVLSLLQTYGIPDPAYSEPGKFRDPAMQDIYDSLTARGLSDPIEALRVGGLIEEADIVDLRRAISYSAKKDIDRVLSNLMEGSTNHLSAFVDALSSRGITYEAQLLPPGELDSLLSR